MNLLRNKERSLPRSQSHHVNHYNAMSTKTKEFIRKICYKKTASVDMTQYGFINDSKLHPINMLMKPLKEQLEKICGKPAHKTHSRRQSPSKRSEKGKASPVKSRRRSHSAKNAKPKEKGKQAKKRKSRKKLKINPKNEKK